MSRHDFNQPPGGGNVRHRSAKLLLHSCPADPHFIQSREFLLCLKTIHQRFFFSTALLKIETKKEKEQSIKDNSKTEEVTDRGQSGATEATDFMWPDSSAPRAKKSRISNLRVPFLSLSVSLCTKARVFFCFFFFLSLFIIPSPWKASFMVTWTHTHTVH